MNGAGHETWLKLRSEVRAAKRAKDWETVIATCEAVLRHSAEHRELAIVDWLFMKDKAAALAKLDRHHEAAESYERAASMCHEYRATARLREPDDFLKDLNAMKKKAAVLRKKP